MSNLIPCVIYARVSSAKQKNFGDGLKGQQKCCRDYARVKGYSVLRVFEDDISGGSVTRTGFDAMLQFLEEQNKTGLEIIVVIDDIKRFARDVINHYALKVEIYLRGGRLESPLFQFEDTPEGKFRETIFAAQAELERTQNARQVRRRMQARLEQGFWPFNAPHGYRYVQHRVHKKIIAPDPTRSGMVKEGLEGYATNRFGSVAEVTRFLQGLGFFNSRIGQSAREMKVHRMLRQILYTGYLEYPAWGISLRKAHHQPLISLLDFERIQTKLEGRSLPILRKDTSKDFPLRNFLACTGCNRCLTASWSRGRSNVYGYYHCSNPMCIEYGKTTPKSTVEEHFSNLLKGYESTDEILDYAEHLAQERWQIDEDQLLNGDKLIDSRKVEIDKEIEKLSERIGGTESDTVFKVLENQIEKLVREHRRLDETATTANKHREDFGTAFQKVRIILKSPYETWILNDVAMKRVVTRMVFPAPIPYARRKGFGTADISLPYRVLRQVEKQQSSLVGTASKSWNRSKHVVDLSDHTVWQEFIATIVEWSHLVNL